MTEDWTVAATLEQRVAAAVRRRFGEAARVRGFARMAGGHAGFTYGFELLSGRHDPPRCVVLKMGPPGVRREGVADVFRQAQLLKALRAGQIPVPAIAWAEGGEEELGAPYIVMERVPGREQFPLRAADDPTPLPAAAKAWISAVEVLVRLHRFPWQTLGSWQTPVTLREEFDRWEPTLAKSPEVSWREDGLRTRDALLARLPDGIATGLCHGDFQTANLLFNGDRVTAVIDWDLASVGPALLDIGWLMMFADGEYWGPSWTTACPVAVAALSERFCRDTGASAADVGWFHAFAGYRFGAIACLNVRLHRTGRRVDPVWERFATDIPTVFARARSLVGELH